ncbi:hypothetical protein D3C75_1320620 [compost metagenome]
MAPAIEPRLNTMTKLSAEPRLKPAIAMSLVSQELRAYTMNRPVMNAVQIITVLNPRPCLNRSRTGVA